VNVTNMGGAKEVRTNWSAAMVEIASNVGREARPCAYS
jgi:hypothetical protein